MASAFRRKFAAVVAFCALAGNLRLHSNAKVGLPAGRSQADRSGRLLVASAFVACIQTRRLACQPEFVRRRTGPDGCWWLLPSSRAFKREGWLASRSSFAGGQVRTVVGGFCLRRVHSNAKIGLPAGVRSQADRSGRLLVASAFVACIQTRRLACQPEFVRRRTGPDGCWWLLPSSRAFKREDWLASRSSFAGGQVRTVVGGFCLRRVHSNAKVGLPTVARPWTQASEGWWTRGGSNSRPLHCERSALPAELRAPYGGLGSYGGARRTAGARARIPILHAFSTTRNQTAPARITLTP